MGYSDIVYPLLKKILVITTVMQSWPYLKARKSGHLLRKKGILHGFFSIPRLKILIDQ